jgi:hypothetical protein
MSIFYLKEVLGIKFITSNNTRRANAICLLFSFVAEALCDLDSHHFRLWEFFHAQLHAAWIVGSRFSSWALLRLLLHFHHKEMNGIPLLVLSVYCWKVLSCICSHSIKKAIFPWARVVLSCHTMSVIQSCIARQIVVAHTLAHAFILKRRCNPNNSIEISQCFFKKLWVLAASPLLVSNRGLCVAIQAIQWPGILNYPFLLGMQYM